jgi:hypothetical protein
LQIWIRHQFDLGKWRLESARPDLELRAEGVAGVSVGYGKSARAAAVKVPFEAIKETGREGIAGEADVCAANIEAAGSQRLTLCALRQTRTPCQRGNEIALDNP